MTRVSGSKLDLVASCSGALALPQTRDRTDAGELGQVKHAFLLQALHEGKEAAWAAAPQRYRSILESLPTDDILRAAGAGGSGTTDGEVAFAWNPVTRDRARFLGYDLGREYDAAGAQPLDLCLAIDAVHVEWELPPIVIKWNDPEARAASEKRHREFVPRVLRVTITDYKSGFAYVAGPAENLQMKAGAVAAASHYQVSEVVERVVRFPEGQPVRVLEDTFSALDLAAFEEEIAEVCNRHREAVVRVAAGQLPDLTVGEHCNMCRARYTCPAQAHAAQMLVPLELRAPLTSETVGRAWELVKAVKRRVEEVEPILRSYITEHGAVPISGGKVARAVDYEVGEVSPVVAQQVLQEMGMGPAFASAATVSASGLAEAVGGGDRAAEVMSRIRDRGGVRQVKRTAVRVVVAEPRKRRRR